MPGRGDLREQHDDGQDRSKAQHQHQIKRDPARRQGVAFDFFRGAISPDRGNEQQEAGRQDWRSQRHQKARLYCDSQRAHPQQGYYPGRQNRGCDSSEQGRRRRAVPGARTAVQVNRAGRAGNAPHNRGREQALAFARDAHGDIAGIGYRAD